MITRTLLALFLGFTARVACTDIDAEFTGSTPPLLAVLYCYGRDNALNIRSNDPENLKSTQIATRQ